VSNERLRQQWEREFGSHDPKIIRVGLNYRDHVAEQVVEAPSAPLLFGKFANTLCSNSEPILLPAEIGDVDAEAELAVVIGERANRVAIDDAFDVIAGWTCANDVSARDAQFGDGPWFRGKGYDTFCPIGPGGP
jgi:2,4-didehydro-3-deoxy-L-rhamnonate hydrolase